MCYIHIPTPQDKYSNFILQTCANKKNLKITSLEKSNIIPIPVAVPLCGTYYFFLLGEAFKV